METFQVYFGHVLDLTHTQQLPGSLKVTEWRGAVYVYTFRLLGNHTQQPIYMIIPFSVCLNSFVCEMSPQIRI